MSSDVTAQTGSSGRQASDDRSRGSTGNQLDPPATADATLPLDQVFEILRNQRRRHVLRLLRDSEEPLLIGDLAEQIAAWENDKQPHEITSSERKRVYVGLYQAHLPKMDGMEVISFNKPRGVIEPDVNIEAFDPYISRDPDRRPPPWHTYYARLSAASVGLLGVAFVLQPVVALPVVQASLVAVVAAFSACSVAHVLWVRRTDESTSIGGHPAGDG